MDEDPEMVDCVEVVYVKEDQVDSMEEDHAVKDHMEDYAVNPDSEV